jgi:hypothetical protein
MTSPVIPKHDNKGDGKHHDRSHHLRERVLANTKHQVGNPEHGSHNRAKENWRERVNGWPVTFHHNPGTGKVAGDDAGDLRLRYYYRAVRVCTGRAFRPRAQERESITASARTTVAGFGVGTQAVLPIPVFETIHSPQRLLASTAGLSVSKASWVEGSQL